MITETLRALGDAIGQLDRGIPLALSEQQDPAANATLLAVIREHRKGLVLLEQFVERATADRMGKAAIEWPGGRAVRHRTSTKVKWHNDDIAAALTVRAMVDDNGELAGEEAQAVGSKVKALIMGCASVAYWRVGDLELQGVDADEHRTREIGRYVVDVTLGEEAEQ